jgi:hypothetical protein
VVLLSEKHCDNGGNKMMNLNYMITILHEGMSKVKVMDPNRPQFKAIRDTLDKADNETLKILYDAKIKFISNMAFVRLAERGVKL